MSVAEYRRLFELVRKRPLMYLIRPDFPTVVAFVVGCDQGNASGLLTGFQEWLVTRVGCGSNLVWWSLVRRLADPEGTEHPGELDPETDAKAVEMLFECLDEFLSLREQSDGLRRVYAAYEAWREARDQAGCRASQAAECPTVEWPRPRPEIAHGDQRG